MHVGLRTFARVNGHKNVIQKKAINED